MTDGLQKNRKKTPVFSCEKCTFICSKKNDYIRHLLTLKHQREDKMDDVGLQKNRKKLPEKFICSCGKIYLYRQGLWKHHKNCKMVKDEDIDPTQPISNEIILNILQQNQELQHILLEQNKTIMEMSKNNNNNQINTIHNNSHNKTFNLQLFLNETCKDAMNLMDFVDSLQIQLSDLENVGKLGYVNGISNIIIKSLKALDITKRPVHCSDHKREVMYVKNQNEWSKEGPDNQNLKKAIKRIAHKNICMIPEWKAIYPDCVFSESKKSDLYNHIMYESMDNNEDNENKIIKKIAKEVVIEK